MMNSFTRAGTRAAVALGTLWMNEGIHSLPMPNLNDELLYSGWNTCSSCFGDSTNTRDKLILPCLMSSRIYVIDVGTEPRASRIHMVVEPEEVFQKTGLANLHTSHCLGCGEIMISFLGDPSGNGKGINTFIMYLWIPHSIYRGSAFHDNEDWERRLCLGEHCNFWWVPVVAGSISSWWTWAAPPSMVVSNRRCGCWVPANHHFLAGHYGHRMHVWDWTKHTCIQTMDFGEDEQILLGIRFLHNSAAMEAMMCCSLSSSVHRVYKDEIGKWTTEKVIQVPSKKVKGWALPDMPCHGADVTLHASNPKRLYVHLYLHRSNLQGTISVPEMPQMSKSLGNTVVPPCVSFVSLPKGALTTCPPSGFATGKAGSWGPTDDTAQFGWERLYVTTSLFSTWDKQFYPEMVKEGLVLMQVDMDTENGGLKTNPNFLVDFGKEPDGPTLAHEPRYPGGDCTSDIWV
uniref:Methanethiol oxidase n=1 Tax=Leptobrachium leishanense TaxID=445787 RepID=A0A8C5R2V4_9ANUR